MKKFKISIIFGTRPEAIKLAPVIKTLQRVEDFQVQVCITGQHKEMLENILEVFQVKPDINFKLMKHNQTLTEFTTRSLKKIDKYLLEFQPDIVMVQGDTTTVLTASLAAYYNQIAIAHVEAGLRSNNLYSPFPEEGNRKLASHLATYHFVPLKTNKENLLLEGIPEKNIYITGNTVIDSLLLAAKIIEKKKVIIPGFPEELKSGKIILITSHRREHFGEKFKEICLTIKDLSTRHPQVKFVYPVHLNPNIKIPVTQMLEGLKNVYLLEPLDYLPFISLLKECYFVITDSGGIQEEAPTFGKPILIIRDNTERQEVIDAGCAELIGTSRLNIIEKVSQLLDDKILYDKKAMIKNPFGDGRASKRIRNILKNIFMDLLP